MLLKLRERMAGEKGFTLIELLVVMLIIGILAAIAIPTFFNQKEKAKDADTKSMAHTAQTAIETYATDHGGSYQGATDAILAGIEETLDPANVDVSGASATGYTVSAMTPGTTGPHTFNIIRSGGGFQYTCTPEGQGGCPDAVGSATVGDWSGDTPPTTP
jgi:type IV pilus assembly protein PilA